MAHLYETTYKPLTSRGAVNADGSQANKFAGYALKPTQIKMTTKQSSTKANKNGNTNRDS